VRVTARDGSSWRVQRYSLRPPSTGVARWRRVADHPNPAGFGEFTGVVVRGEAAGWAALIDLLVAVLRWSAAVVCAPVGIALCLLRLRPWPVTAKRRGRARRVHLWSVRGRTASNDLLAEIVDSLRTGRHLPAGDIELTARARTTEPT
jgi:hypothetical protein